MHLDPRLRECDFGKLNGAPVVRIQLALIEGRKCLRIAHCDDQAFAAARLGDCSEPMR